MSDEGTGTRFLESAVPVSSNSTNSNCALNTRTLRARSNGSGGFARRSSLRARICSVEAGSDGTDRAGSSRTPSAAASTTIAGAPDDMGASTSRGAGGKTIVDRSTVNIHTRKPCRSLRQPGREAAKRSRISIDSGSANPILQTSGSRSTVRVMTHPSLRTIAVANRVDMPGPAKLIECSADWIRASSSSSAGYVRWT
jgi:hypothetical protein